MVTWLIDNLIIWLIIRSLIRISCQLFFLQVGVQPKHCKFLKIYFLSFGSDRSDNWSVHQHFFKFESSFILRSSSGTTRDLQNLGSSQTWALLCRSEVSFLFPSASDPDSSGSTSVDPMIWSRISVDPVCPLLVLVLILGHTRVGFQLQLLRNWSCIRTRVWFLWGVYLLLSALNAADPGPVRTSE